MLPSNQKEEIVTQATANEYRVCPTISKHPIKFLISPPPHIFATITLSFQCVVPGHVKRKGDIYIRDDIVNN